jgi:aspartate kinase
MRLVQPVAAEIGARGVVTADDLAKVSIVGTGIQFAPGYAAQMFKVLADAGINIDMITTSEIRITCIVDQANVERAVRALHATFQLDRPD